MNLGDDPMNVWTVRSGPDWPGAVKFVDSKCSSFAVAGGDRLPANLDAARHRCQHSSNEEWRRKRRKRRKRRRRFDCWSRIMNNEDG